MKDSKLDNKIRQKNFYDSMTERGYKRRHIWYSKRSQILLNKLSQHYSQEIVIEEALEILALTKVKLPDKRYCDGVTLSWLKQYMKTSKRDEPKHFEIALGIIKKRIRVMALMINTVGRFTDNNDD